MTSPGSSPGTGRGVSLAIVQLGLLRRPATTAFDAGISAIRWRAKRQLQNDDSVTVVTANWNTLNYLTVCIDMVRRYSPEASHLILDNASSDGSGAWLRNQNVQTTRLPRNVGHARALDLGFLLAKSEYVVALDVDAFPISGSWLQRLLDPLRDGARVAGVTIENPAISYPYAHPCCLAMRRSDFVRANLTFVHSSAEHDVGSEISLRFKDDLHLIPLTSARGPGATGAVFFDVAYHNWGSTRPELYDTGAAAWSEALRRYVHV